MWHLHISLYKLFAGSYRHTHRRDRRGALVVGGKGRVRWRASVYLHCNDRFDVSHHSIKLNSVGIKWAKLCLFKVNRSECIDLFGLGPPLMLLVSTYQFTSALALRWGGEACCVLKCHGPTIFFNFILFHSRKQSHHRN